MPSCRTTTASTISPGPKSDPDRTEEPPTPCARELCGSTASRPRKTEPRKRTARTGRKSHPPLAPADFAAAPPHTPANRKPSSPVSGTTFSGSSAPRNSTAPKKRRRPANPDAFGSFMPPDRLKATGATSAPPPAVMPPPAGRCAPPFRPVPAPRRTPAPRTERSNRRNRTRCR